METNFMQVVKLSDEEQIELYLKQPKRKLAEMLTESNKHLEILSRIGLPVSQENGGQWIKATPENMPINLEVWKSDLGQNVKIALWNGSEPILVSNNFEGSKDGKTGYTHYLHLPPLPVVAGEQIEDIVIAKIKQRQQIGIKKYGCTVKDNPLTETEWLNHLQEELLDAAIYIERIKSQREA